MMRAAFILICLVPAAVEAFTPSSKCASTVRSSHLFMDKRKSRTKAGSQPQGFAGAIKNQQTKFPYAGSVRPGNQSPQRVVVDQNILRPDYADDGIPKKGRSSPLLPWVIEVKTPEEIEKMRAAGRLAREILDMAGRAVAVGVTTDEIDSLVHEATIKVRPKETLHMHCADIPILIFACRVACPGGGVSFSIELSRLSEIVLYFS